MSKHVYFTRVAIFFPGVHYLYSRNGNLFDGRLDPLRAFSAGRGADEAELPTGLSAVSTLARDFAICPLFRGMKWKEQLAFGSYDGRAREQKLL